MRTSHHVISTGALVASLLTLGLCLEPMGLDPRAAFLSLIIVLVGLAVFARWKPEERPHFAIGPCAMAVVYGMIFATGGPAASTLAPLPYVVIAVSSSVLSPRSAIFTGAVMGAFEIAMFATSATPTLGLLFARLGFASLFASLFSVVLRSRVDTIEESRKRAVGEALAEIDRDARDFRLIGSSLGPESGARSPEAAAQARRVGSVRAIRESLLDVLDAARLAVDADDAMIFMLDPEGDRLRLKECVAKEDDPPIVDKPIASEGAIGAVIKTGRSVYMKPRSGGRGLGYEVRREVKSFLGIPIMGVRDQCVVGVLAVDRASEEEFGEKDEEILASIAREAERAMESERIFAEMDKVKYEQERFYEAFSLLNEAPTVDVFAKALLEAVARIKPVDFLAVTLFDQESQVHTITCGRGAAETLSGNTFKNKAGGLVVTALKNGHPLPYVPLSAQSSPKLQLFSPKIDVALESVKVFPLLDRGRPLGALVVGSTEAGRDLCREEERMLETVTVHAARTLANAQMYQHMEMMATTDGLTGLTNHRRFKELLGEALARAKRFSRHVSVLMVDADHFKLVNDTYGHAVGDLVLERIARILEAEARRTDVVARYGGEEFVVALDETDVNGALRVAERIRERVEREVVQGEFGRVRVTVSLGLACWPEQGSGPSGEEVDAVIDAADQALYEAKRKGRNRVEVFGGIVKGDPPRPSIPPEPSPRSSHLSR